MSRWMLGAVLICACGGSSKPAPEPPPLPPPVHTIDCAKLTDHTIQAMLVGSANTPEDLAARRAKMLADCPSVWHADHPSQAELDKADCLMATKNSSDIQACMGPAAVIAPTPLLHTPKSGIPECDSYAAKLESLLHCDQVAQNTRDKLQQDFEQSTTGWASIPDDKKPKLAKDCTLGMAAIKQIASSMKCSLDQ